MIYAVDFDGTLCYGDKPNIRLIEWLKDKRANGDKVILWTCRHGEMLNEALVWCRKQGIEFDAVNENLPEMIEKYGDTRKIGCDYYIDDTHFTSDFLIKKTEIKATKKKARIL